jgi:hypothetical protein
VFENVVKEFDDTEKTVPDSACVVGSLNRLIFPGDCGLMEMGAIS